MPDDMTNILQPAAGEEALDPQKKIDLENGVNQGVIAPTFAELAAVGADQPSVAGLPVLAPDSNWDRFLSQPYERQKNNNFDTLGCNIFSSVHSVEAFINALGGDPLYPPANMVDLSERAACVNAGLNGNQGSSEAMWEAAMSQKGMVSDLLWPFTDDMTKTEFFKALPQNIKDACLNFLDNYTPSFRQISTDLPSIKEALKYAPVKIFVGTGFGWNKGEPNVIPKTNNPMGHAVMVRKISDLGTHIYDQYPPYLKVLSPDYTIYYAFQTLLIRKGEKMIGYKHPVNDTVYLPVGGGTLVPITDWATFLKLGGSEASVVRLTAEQFAKYTVAVGAVFTHG